ncbi:cell wall-binding repeat-containing protein [Peptostreptococcus faecalis]|uniref:cell wall-binding repeat-containing protein n=1 Tax=Peptostreptococcus faecalis TaxID=2045015 RepID=UPI000C7D7881|nr:cell wall-binding repeat-containing protein [Peptostreptococcus faecalis]
MKKIIFTLVASIALIMSLLFYTKSYSDDNSETSSKTFVVASASSDSDLIVAAPLSNFFNTDLITNNKGKINTSKINKKTDKVIIIGGENSVSSNLLKGYNTERLSGKNKYETALKVFKYRNNIEKIDSVYLTSGKKPSDAVVAAANSIPVLLTIPEPIDTVQKRETLGNLKKETKDYKKIIIGGTASVSDRMSKFLDADRISGMNRFETSEKFNTTLDRKSNLESYSDKVSENVRLANIAYLEDKGFLLKRMKIVENNKVIAKNFSPNTTPKLREISEKISSMPITGPDDESGLNTRIYDDGTACNISLDDVISASKKNSIKINIHGEGSITLTKKDKLYQEFIDVINEILREEGYKKVV